MSDPRSSIRSREARGLRSRVLASLVGAALVASLATIGAGTPSSAASSDPLWLQWVNFVREIGNQGEVLEDAGLSAHAEEHANYMVLNGLGVSCAEVSGSPGFTQGGSEVDCESNRFLKSDPGAPTYDVEDAFRLWATNPFNLAGMIDPRLSYSGYGDKFGMGFQNQQWFGASLNVLRGLSAGAIGATQVYPGDGETLPHELAAMSTTASNPDPLDPCKGFGWNASAGAPIVVMYDGTPNVGVGKATPSRAVSIGGSNVQDAFATDNICWYDETHRGAVVDGTAKPLANMSDVGGALLPHLKARHLLVIIPRYKLSADDLDTPGDEGKHFVSVGDACSGTSWSFSVASPGVIELPNTTTTTTTTATTTTTTAPGSTATTTTEAQPGMAPMIERVAAVRPATLNSGNCPTTTTTTSTTVEPTTTTRAPTTTRPAGAPTPRSGYWMADLFGKVYPFGAAGNYGNVVGVIPQGGRLEDLEGGPGGKGYWLLDDYGNVYAGSPVKWYGEAVGDLLRGERAASLSSTPTGEGYWIFTDHGRVFAYGDARFFGDMTNVPLNSPVIESVALPGGDGYYMVATDGGIFSFGRARFFGSMGGVPLNEPIVGLVPTADGRGYWLDASDGGVFAFGRARFRGSLGALSLSRPIIGMVRYGNGYLMAGSDGGVFNFSNQPFFGSLAAQSTLGPVVTIDALG